MMAAARAQKPETRRARFKASGREARGSKSDCRGEGSDYSAGRKTSASKARCQGCACCTSTPKATASILAAARTAEKPGPMTKAEAATKPRPTREAATAAKAKLTVPPMPPKPAYAAAKPKAETASRRSPRIHEPVVRLVPRTRLHIAERDHGALDAGHGAVHVPEHSDRAAEPIQGRLQRRLVAGAS